ncbi:DNA topoisomerase 3 [Sugiyamaella lignohabitans]|uniref:DNA topoisomerase n=1 Tax=Sugiyamaella lignohabitans TaxID=796027 RepID=A0A161HHI9_9ASCO|nr:DNA topoisomerase 3 [Sugiyamaella lignohabitans]ANB11627.1 DNA topoisomerase 3 [Sugiyamaella lignohabitans]
MWDPVMMFEAPVVRVEAQPTVSSNIQAEGRRADKLFIWTDCDREGENIGWEISQIVKAANRNLGDRDIKRAIFNNTDPDHLRQATLRPANLDLRQADAVSGRSEFDLRTGVAYTRFLTLTLKSNVPALKEEKAISYGSCQFPTLGFVVDRYKRVKDFKPEPFWYIDIKVKKGRKPVVFSWERGRLFDRLATTVIFEQCLNRSSTATVVKVNSKPATKYRPLPLTTIELQKQGARWLKMSSKKIMDVSLNVNRLNLSCSN